MRPADSRSRRWAGVDLRRDADERLAGKVLSRGCGGVSAPTGSKMSALRASPSSRTRRAVTVSSGIGRFLAGISRRNGRNHRSPGGLTGGCPPPTGAARWRRLPGTLCLCLMSCVTHVNRRSGRFGRGESCARRPLVTGDPVARSYRAQPLPIWSAGGSRDPGGVVAAERMTLVPAARDLRLRNRPAAALT
jgi:hypothetical protein